jgi:hypothetical protein
MNHRLALVAIPALGLASLMSACSSSPTGSGNGEGPGTKPGDAGVNAPAPTILADGCPVNSGYVGDSQCLAAPDPTKGFQMHYGPKNYADPAEVAPYVLPPGGEINDCYYMKTPNTTDVYIGGYQFWMRPGSHHLNGIVNTTAQADGFATCGPNDQSPGLLLGTETPKTDALTDPAAENAGMATFLPANSQAVINFHVINTTTKPILREAWLNYMFMDKSQVQQLRGNLFLTGGVGFEITAGTQQTYTYSCSPNRPVRVTAMAAHMHAHSSRMTAWKVTGGVPTKVYETYDWSTPTQILLDSVHTNPMFNPTTQTGGGVSGEMTLLPTDSLQWECAVNNDSSATLTFRDEVFTGEMCIMTGLVVPTDNPLSQYDFTCLRN